ncbi:MAG: hypothetical protein HXK88_10285 [Lachnospiraceae bacterium]|nr:hypothetical protein [Lachnospiraceae bacterium]
MNKNVALEKELYPPMRRWLGQYLRDKYPNTLIKTLDTSEVTLDSILEKEGIIEQYPQAVGVNIQIDVLGLVTDKWKTRLIFIEAKKEFLNLHHLGQLWAYCKLIDPAEAFLMSSRGMGSLDKILINLRRTDLLDFGDPTEDKKIYVSAWDVLSRCPDMKTMVPRM